MRFLFLITLYSLSHLTSYAVFFKNIGIREGLSQLSVHSIYQDKLGRMWFGTMEGLNVFNGEEMVSYKSNNYLSPLPIKNNAIYVIVGNKEGDVFYIVDSHLIKYNLNKDRFECIGTNASALSESNGKVYTVLNDSILSWNEKKNKFDFITIIPTGKKINQLFMDSSNRLWIGKVDGLFLFTADGSFRNIIPQNDITTIFESLGKDIWVGTRAQGMYRIGKNEVITEFINNPANPNSISHNYVRTFEEDSTGNLWIGTFGGLNKYNSQSGIFNLYTQDYLQGSLTHSSIFSLYKDRQGTMWVGTYYGGVNYFNCEKNSFTYYSYNTSRNDCINFPFVGHMAEDKNQNIWICTEGGGLNRLNRQTNRFSYYTAGLSKDAIKHNNLKCICFDAAKNKLYIGTYTGGLCCYDITTGHFRNYLDEAGYDGSKHKNITQISLFKDELIILDDYGLSRLNPETGIIVPLFSDTTYSRYTGADFIIDSEDYLWLANFSNVVRINLREVSTEPEFFQYGEHGLSFSTIVKIIETKQHDIYMATEGSGIFRFAPATKEFTAYTTENKQLSSNFCYNIAESKQGNLVILNDKGISFLHPEKGLLYTAHIGKELPFSAINRGCGLLVSNNGEIFAGSANGLVSFYEEDLLTVNDRYNLYFSGIAINNHQINPDDKNNALQFIPAYTERISLNYKQNNLIFTFANSNYVNSSNSSYVYTLEGFDTQWISTNSTKLTYTNLNPGNYILKVRETLTGNYPPKEIQLAITIKPPFYNTFPAWLFYIIVTISLIYSFILFRQRQIRLRTSLEFERREKEYITNLNKAKLSFFANISHEFRTPLTLIITQIEMLIQHNTTPKSIHNKIQSIYKNAYQLRYLINELLDFQKLEQKQTQLKVHQKDLISFIKDTFVLFDSQAEAKQIRYTFSSTEEPILCWFDPEQLKKVFYNLLSNAFKFTSRQGFIEVVITRKKESVIIKVIDNGTGIEKKDLNKIFEQYYQASNSLKSPQQDFSTGLGLALSMDIITLHHGTISVESSPGYGSIFTIVLKTGNAHFAGDLHSCMEEEGSEESIIQDSVFNKTFISDSSGSDNLPVYTQEEERHTILIVEDNEELLQVLAAMFSPLYNILLAHNGEEGLTSAIDNKPDIIVSDVVMPQMTGTEMCLHIKNNINTCHIPVVLLTAQSSTEKNIDGLQKGADDYITKPFNTKILITRCNNLIRNRLLQQQRYQKEPDSTIQLLADNELDKEFLSRIERIIEQNISEPEFSIDTLAQEIAMSRSSVYRKFKTLTGLTPNDFILNYKLKQAAFMLEKRSDLQINDISDTLGFGSARYFSRCFKKQFNISPMDYKKSKAPQA